MSFQDIEKGPPPSSASRRVMDSNRQSITASIFQISTSINAFTRLVNTLGTPKDTVELREKLQKTRQLITQLAKDISTELKELSEQDHAPSVSRQRKAQDAKLARDFQNILKDFQKAQRQSAERETAFAPYVPRASQPASRTSREEFMSSEPESRQALMSVETELQYNEAVINEREEGIREIQGQIEEVREIFVDLGAMVNEQGHMIDSIDDHIESSYSATKQANVQLNSAAKYQKSSGSLACCLMVLFTLALIIIIFVMVGG